MTNNIFNTVALIPLRGGSKSIPLKNVKEIGGKPLCAWVIEAATKTKSIDQVFVSTDSTVIKNVVESLNLGVIVIDRPGKYAEDDSTTESVMLHFLEQVQFNNLVTIQATSPLVTSQQLDEAIDMFINKGLDSLLTAVLTKRFYWNLDGKPLNYQPTKRPRRQEFDGTYVENGAFYITKAEILQKYQCRLGGQIGIYEMPEESFVEIDEPSDWNYVSKLLEKCKI